MYYLGQVLAGLAYSYCVSSLVEHLIHRYVHHATAKFRRLWGIYPYLFGMLLRAFFFHHVVHHRLTYKQNHVTQFADAVEEETLTLKGQGRLARVMRTSRHGLTLTAGGVLRLVFLLAALILIPASVVGPWTVLGCVPPVLAVVAMSTVIHPWLHVAARTRAASMSQVGRWWFGTRYMRLVIQHHYLHHRYGGVNFNLLLGADHILGVVRRANPADIAKMMAIGLIE